VHSDHDDRPPRVGRMHAATIGKRGRFAEILDELGRTMSRPDESAEAQFLDR